jgi:hypothetical protein
MPNWCNNDLTLRHKDPAMLDRAQKALAEGRFLNEFIPCPPELHKYSAPEQDDARADAFTAKYGAPDWYSWQIKNWGTKWDVDADPEQIKRNWGTKWDVDADPEQIERAGDTLTVSFDSAWSPPIEAYNRLVEMGFEVQAYYNEFGMTFAGMYTGAGGDIYDDCVDYGSWTAEQVRQEIPLLDERFGISQWLEDSQEIDQAMAELRLGNPET